MSTESFRRHTRRRADAAVHRVCASLAPVLRRDFLRLVRAAYQRSDLLRALPRVDTAYRPLDALRNLACFPAALTGDPETWPGATGHPLRVVDSLARHVLGRYPVPRVLAQVWFGGRTPRELERRGWYVAHSRGQAFRTLALPIAMTRRIEHAFLRTRDDRDLDRALRRAEVIGLGGSPELADAVCETWLGRSLDHAAFWRRAIDWLVRHEAELRPWEVAPIIQYVEDGRLGRACRYRELAPDPELGGRSYRAVIDAVWRWVFPALYSRPLYVVTAPPTSHEARSVWPRTRWAELVHVGEDARWRLIELVDSDELRLEGTAMRHCVATYTWRCLRGESSIWSLRRRDDDAADDYSVLTIEVDPRSATIVQVRGVANARGVRGAAAEVLRRWADRECLRLACDVQAEVVVAPPPGAA